MTNQSSAAAVHPVSFDAIIISRIRVKVNIDLGHVLWYNMCSLQQGVIYMSIQGTPGVTIGETKSATYGPTQYREFIEDAEELGLVIDIVESKAWAYDAKGLITGEWSSKVGGQLAWS